MSLPTTEEKLAMDLDEIVNARKAADAAESWNGAKRGRDDNAESGAVVRVSRRVYVSNLPWSTSWQDLKDFFRQAGNVVYASVMTDDDTGRSKGCGIVEFETADEAVRAIETLHDAELDGRRVSVREDREDRDLKASASRAPAPALAQRLASKRIRGTEAAHAFSAETENGPRVGKRVFVSNLAWSTSWQDLKDFFRQAGNVVYASVMTEDDTGRSKGCGIVEFETPDEAAVAIETLHDAELDGRKVSVREDREDRDLKPAKRAITTGPSAATSSDVVRVGRRVYVGNLAWSTSWQDLKDFFRQAGNVVYASVMTDDETGRSKGCGIVEFETSEEAVKAIETLHDAELDGRKVTVREDREDRDLKSNTATNRYHPRNNKRVRAHRP